VSPTPILPAVEAELVRYFGCDPARASVSFVGVEQIEVLRFDVDLGVGGRAYVSLGMARHAMTGADQVIRSDDGPRAELMLHVHDAADRHYDVWRRIALLAAAPVVEGVVYRGDMSVDLGEPMAEGSTCSGFVVAPSVVPAISVETLDVAILRVIPATSNELAWCRARGVAGLRERWSEFDVDLLDLSRPSVPLG
jgi:Suppressor of fused protein (SUFU)